MRIKLNIHFQLRVNLKLMRNLLILGLGLDIIDLYAKFYRLFGLILSPYFQSRFLLLSPFNFSLYTRQTQALKFHVYMNYFYIKFI